MAKICRHWSRPNAQIQAARIERSERALACNLLLGIALDHCFPSFEKTSFESQYDGITLPNGNLSFDPNTVFQTGIFSILLLLLKGTNSSNGRSVEDDLVRSRLIYLFRLVFESGITPVEQEKLTRMY